MQYLSKGTMGWLAALILSLTVSGTSRASDPYYDRLDRAAAAAKADNKRADDYNYFKQKDLQKIDRAADARRAANRPLENKEWFDSIEAQLNAAAKKRTGIVPSYVPTKQPMPASQRPSTMSSSAAQAVTITQSKAARDAHFQELMRKSAPRR